MSLLYSNQQYKHETEFKQSTSQWFCKRNVKKKKNPHSRITKSLPFTDTMLKTALVFQFRSLTFWGLILDFLLQILDVCVCVLFGL